MRTNIYKEVTNDRGYQLSCYASNNASTYILQSAYSHDMYHEFVDKYGRIPSAQWYRKHFNFERVQD